MRQFSLIKIEKCLLAAFFFLPAVLSSTIFHRAALLHGRYLLLSSFLAFSGIVSLGLATPRLRSSPLGQGLYRSVPVVCFMVAIYLMSALRVPSKTSTFLPDYVYHSLEFTAFGFLCMRVLGQDRSQNPRMFPLMLAVLFCIVYAAFDEFHQRYVPTRTPSLKDFFVDTLGIATGIMGYVWLTLKIKVAGESAKDEDEKARAR